MDTDDPKLQEMVKGLGVTALPVFKAFKARLAGLFSADSTQSCQSLKVAPVGALGQRLKNVMRFRRRRAERSTRASLATRRLRSRTQWQRLPEVAIKTPCHPDSAHAFSPRRRLSRSSLCNVVFLMHPGGVREGGKG